MLFNCVFRLLFRRIFYVVAAVSRFYTTKTHPSHGCLAPIAAGPGKRAHSRKRTPCRRALSAAMGGKRSLTKPENPVSLARDRASLGGYAQPRERSLIGLPGLGQVLVGLKS